jgi:hypothetical protein
VPTVLFEECRPGPKNMAGRFLFEGCRPRPNNMAWVLYIRQTRPNGMPSHKKTHTCLKKIKEKLPGLLWGFITRKNAAV